jgi:fibronectin-binding autotransporter adhesin
MKQKSRVFLLVPLWFSALAPMPLTAVIQINDGATYTINSYQIAADDFDLDHQATAGGGELVINATGSLIFHTARTISNTFGEGKLVLNGDLIHNANAPSTISANVDANAGSILRASQTSLSLSGGGIFEGNLDAQGGDIYLTSGNHLLSGATITGNNSVNIFGGSVSVAVDVNPSTGPATGGLIFQSGTLTGVGALFGGGGNSMISTARATLSNGTINGATIRITDTGTISSYSDTLLTSGRIINEGMFTHAAYGDINVDASNLPGGGSVVNHGTWKLLGFSDVSNTHGDGEFINHSAVLQDDPLGFSIISAKFTNKSGATLQAVSGSLIQLMGGGIYETGSTLNAIGEISFRKGTHTIFNANLDGSGSLRVDTAETNLWLFGNIGPLSGAATGGLILSGGTITNSGLTGGGGNLAVQRGEFQSGTIAGAFVRVTGAAEKTSGASLRIDSGSLTIESTMVQRNNGDFQLDGNQLENIHGTIVNRGTWTMDGYSSIFNQHGEGAFINHSTFHKSGNGTISTCSAAFTNQENAIIQADSEATMIFDGGGVYKSGTQFSAAGVIGFGNGSHLVSSSVLTGGGYLRTIGSGARLVLLGDIGPASGPAVGGFHFGGGTITNLTGLLGGAGSGTGIISAERGKLAWGTLDGAVLRFTGLSEKVGNSEVQIRQGRLINQGTLTQAEEGDFEIDPDSDTNIHGTIENHGTWRMTGSSTIQSYYGGGSFQNYGVLQMDENADLGSIHATLINHETGVIRARTGAYLSLLGTTSHLPGSVLDADGGVISFSLGSHFLNGCQITGANAIRCSSDAFHIISRIGPQTGPATGGFSLEGGVLRGEYDSPLGILITGPGQGEIAVDHGQIQYGRIEKAHLRYTGAASKSNTIFSFAIADGSLTNDGTFTQSANGNIELHATSPANNGGTVYNRGSWQSLGTSTVSSTAGGGLFHNAGLLTHASGTLTIAAPFENVSGGTLSTMGGTIVLTKNTIHHSGSVLNADNGNIRLQSSTHSFQGGSFNGAGFVELTSGTMQLLGNVGNTIGAATGKLLFNGGTISGTSTLSVSDATLLQGTISGSATIRLTGSSNKSAANILSLNGGILRNEGTMAMAASSQINADSLAGGAAGVIRNEGEWYTLGGTITNTGGSGVFENNGLFRNDSGNFTFHCAFNQLTNGHLQNKGGTIYLNAGGQHAAGSLLDADLGDIYFNGGTHVFAGGELAGNGMVYCTSGTVQMNGDIGNSSGPANGGFGIAGGTITGTGTLSARRGYISSGTIGGSVQLRFTENFTKPINTTLNMNGGTLQSEGLFESPGGADFNLDSSSSSGAGTIVNKGTWRVSNAFTYSNSFGGGVFRNEGLFESMAGISMMAAAFHSEAGSILRAKSGYVRLGGGGIHKPDSTFDADGGDIYLSSGTHQFLGGNFIGSGYVHATGATVSIQSNVGPSSGAATGGFGIYAGTINGTAMLSAERGILEAGTITGSVTIRLTGSSSKTTNSTLNMNGGTIVNEGVMTGEASGNLNLDSISSSGAGTIVNKGIWRTNQVFTYSNSFDDGVFRNEGLFESMAGISMMAAAFHSEPGSTFRAKSGYVRLGGGGIHKPDSTFDADGGDIYLSAGTHQFLGGNFIGSGYVHATGATVSIQSNVGPSSGTATGGFGIYAGTITGTAMLSVERGILNAGMITGTATIRLTGQSNKTTNATLNMNGGTILNEGTMTSAASGDFNLDSISTAGAGTIINRGIWVHNGGSNIANSFGDGSIHNFGLWHVISGNSTNAGYFTHQPDSTFRVSGGQMIFTGGSKLMPGSTIEVNQGYLYHNGGTHTWEGGSITGDLFVYCGAGATTVSGDVGASTGPATGGFGIYSSGTLNGSATLSVDHGYLAAGSVSGTVTLRVTGNSNKITNTVLNMNGGTIRNEGTMNVAASGDFNLDHVSGGGAGNLINMGTWVHNAGSNISNTNNQGRIDNHGLWHVISGNSTNAAYFTHHTDSSFRVSGGQMIFTGGSKLEEGALIEVNNGHLYLNGGTHTLEGGSITGAHFVYCGAGVTTVTGNVGATSGSATGGFGIYSSGTLNGTGTISVDHGYLAAGSVAGSVTLRLTGESNKIADTVLSMNGGTIHNEGTMNVAASGDFNLDSTSSAGAGIIHNAGLWKHLGSCNFSNTNNNGTVQNSGTWEVIAGTTNMIAPFSNSGTTRVMGGTLSLQRGSSHTGALISNSSVSFVGSGHSVSGSNAYLGGTGSFSGAVSLRNAARLAPGNSTGTLTLFGNVQFLSSTDAPAVIIELDSASHFDQVALGNGATLSLGNGVTDLQLSLGYQPLPGQTFRIVAAGTSTGTFSGRFRNAPSTGDLVSSSYGGNQHQFRVNYDPGNKSIDLVYQSGFQLWMIEKGLTGNDAAFSADPDGDGVPNGIEFILGRDPRPGYPDPHFPNENNPEIDATHFIFTHRRTHASRYLPTVVQYNSDLGPAWNNAQQGLNGVIVTVSENFHGTGIDKVETRIPRALASDGRIFLRLHSQE